MSRDPWANPLRRMNPGLRQELAAFRLAWSDEDQYPFWRSPGGGLAVHTRACKSAQRYIDSYLYATDPSYRVGFPILMTWDEVLTPRRPAYRPCKWCEPPVNPPLRPLLPPRPKTQRDRVAAWLRSQYGHLIDNTSNDWQQAADELMRHMKNGDNR